MSAPVHVLIPAAGAGRRMGGPVSKQFLHLAGEPVLRHTLRPFLCHPRVSDIYLIVPREAFPFCREQVLASLSGKPVYLVAGGKERQDSVGNGLRACAAVSEELILVHDGVRPFVSRDLIDRLLAAAEEKGAAICAVPPKDTVKRLEAGLVVATLERNNLCLVQTPQVFRSRVLTEAHARAARDGHLGTDEASLVERLGWPVAVVTGDYRNIKITTPEDLQIAGLYLTQADRGDACA